MTIGVIGFLALLNNWWLPLVSPILAWIMGGSLVTAWGVSQERREREVLMRLFGQHVDEDIAETLWKHRHQHSSGMVGFRRQQLTVTVLFADLRSVHTSG